jgi:Polysaccharide biosynthesis/export protein
MWPSAGLSGPVLPQTPVRVEAAQADPNSDLAPGNLLDQSPGGPVAAIEPVISPAPPASLNDGSNIINAERLMIKFQGYPDLSGEYRVNPDLTITIPVIGRVSIANSDSTQLERVLAERAAQAAGREAFVTVEIAQYHPIFITGYVNTSGAIPWRPGMTVLHAVSMAGGLYRAGGDKAAMLNGDVEATRLQRATTDLTRVLATLARLKAEDTGAETITIPPRLLELAGPTEAQQLIYAQQSSFVSRRRALETQRTMLIRGIDTSEQELSGLHEQAERLKEQLKVRHDLKVKLDELLKRGIVRQDRVMEEMARIADLEEKSTNVAVAMARVESSLIQMRREIQGLQQEHEALLDSEMLKFERESAQLEIEIKSARSAYNKVTGGAPESDSFAGINKKLSIQYRITRNGEDESASEQVDEHTALRPGDILVVGTK